MPCINKGILQGRFMENVQKIIPAGIILLLIAVVEYMHIVCCLINNFTKTVIPAEAGIQTPSLQKQGTIKATGFPFARE